LVSVAKLTFLEKHKRFAPKGHLGVRQRSCRLYSFLLRLKAAAPLPHSKSFASYKFKNTVLHVFRDRN
jgi:hypothetical protein